MAPQRQLCGKAAASRGTGRAPLVLAVARPRVASSSVVREVERSKPVQRVVVEVGPGGRRRSVKLGGGTAGVPPAQTADAVSSLDAGSTTSGSIGISSIEAAGGYLAGIRSFFLPRGWPHSVTPDYLQYQLTTVPSHITGHMSHSLATSSMIQALGVGAGPATVVATSAAIKWITKDGLGAAGRLIVGGRLASVFDEDPKRWRMVAEGVVTIGLALEIATSVFPGSFVALAGAGTLCKSMAKGMGRPCFRVIQTHFSATNNVGDVAAKEEVWEVVAQLAGLAASVALLQLLESVGRPELAMPAWLAVHGTHVAFRYVALSSLRFPYPNQKRAALMTSSHVSTGQVPSIEEANTGEQVLLPPSYCHPRVMYGCTLDEALGSSADGGSSSSSSEGGGGQRLDQLLQLYSGERYLLTCHSGVAWVLLHQDACQRDMLRAMWQAAWLEQQQQVVAAQPPPAASAAASGPGSSQHAAAGAAGAAVGDAGRLAASLAALQQQWPDFERQAAQQGWQLEKAVLPQGLVRLAVYSSSL